MEGFFDFFLNSKVQLLMEGLKDFQWRLLVQVNAVSTERGALQEALCTSILWSRASKKEKLIVTSQSRCVSDPQENEEKKKRKHKQNEGWGCNLIGYGLLNMHTRPWVWSSVLHKPGICDVWCAPKSKPQHSVAAGRSGTQSHPMQHSKLEASLR